MPFSESSKLSECDIFREWNFWYRRGVDRKGHKQLSKNEQDIRDFEEILKFSFDSGTRTYVVLLPQTGTVCWLVMGKKGEFPFPFRLGVALAEAKGVLIGTREHFPAS